MVEKEGMKKISIIFIDTQKAYKVQISVSIEVELGTGTSFIHFFVCGSFYIMKAELRSGNKNSVIPTMY